MPLPAGRRACFSPFGLQHPPELLLSPPTRCASVPCAPVRPQARKFALRHAAQALSSRALIGHVRQPGPTQKGSGAARQPTGHTRRTNFLLVIRIDNNTRTRTYRGRLVCEQNASPRQFFSKEIRSFLYVLYIHTHRYTHTHTHAHTHARTHAHTHAHICK